MPFLEWRKFTFCDLKEKADDGKLSIALKDVEISVWTSGNNQIVLGDTKGYIYLISRSWIVTTFKAYALKVHLAYQLKNEPYLITIGDDEPGINPTLKVWDLSHSDKTDTPFCSRVTRTIPNNRPVQANALCVHENRQLLVVGFADGSILLYRGDITRDRSSKGKILKDGGPPVTGLSFKSTSSAILLFIATEVSVFVYNITQKDKEHKIHLDTIGCSKNCSVLAESIQESHFVIAAEKAVYFYTSDGKGPCYAVDGEKIILEWFRSYLVIVSKSNKPQNDLSNIEPHSITVYDIQNKFIIFSANIKAVKAVFNEWGALYILDSEHNVYHLDEKDLQTKLSLLFKKNLYDFAIRVAKSEQYDSDGLVNIFQQYGDHLYSKGAHSSAIEQYIKTIGKLEPSYVIRKFVDSQHIESLTTYLEAIHKQGQANEDHTTLLLNCFTKLNKTDSLKEFILMKDGEAKFDVDIAIKVCRQGNPQEALLLAKEHKRHDWYIKLLIEDHKKYNDVVEYISTLSFKDAESFMKKYGSILIQNAPYESTQFLKRLCTNYTATETISTIDMLEGVQKADAEDYIHLFLNNSTRLVEFLEHLIQQDCFLSSPVYDTLLEHYLHVWGAEKERPEKEKWSQKILKLLQNSDTKCDKPQALVLCHMHGFSKGILYLYEEQKLYQQILRYHMSRGDTNAILSCCKRYGQQEPSLWTYALFYSVQNEENPPLDILPEVLSAIAKEQLLSPQFVIEAIGTGKANINLGHISSYIMSEFKKEQDIIDSDSELTRKYNKDIESLRDQLETLKNGPTVIQGSRCAACTHQLELPSIHFLCQHSFHQICFQSYSENEKECPACQPENKKIIELLKAKENTKDLNETFHSELDKRSDGVSLAAEYFGRGVFNKIKIITDNVDNVLDKIKPVEKVSNTSSYGNYGPGAEAKIRQIENARGSPMIQVVSEGRIRLQEKNISSIMEVNTSVPIMTRKEPPKKAVIQSTNPFEEYDESKDPFAEGGDDEDDDKNPFKNDVDKNSNPFEM
ncbi:vacuolar protein sorting-associated protein 11 homolog [Onthophagus taurus]|uniref:vacuolar protein sorting-associated protein 11 homolog n=1 Tax=Onthophagus taurus TaxID=166361 RepID=UPI0039BEB21C